MFGWLLVDYCQTIGKAGGVNSCLFFVWQIGVTINPLQTIICNTKPTYEARCQVSVTSDTYTTTCCPINRLLGMCSECVCTSNVIPGGRSTQGPFNLFLARLQTSFADLIIYILSNSIAYEICLLREPCKQIDVES